jgi:3-deoxy-D-manno-octulosonic acid kinase
MTQSRVLTNERSTLLYDAARHAAAEQAWFERDYWQRRGGILHETAGRGSVLVVAHQSETWVLRHYHRGGLVARLVTDHYLWLGLERTRSFREWRLLANLRDGGLPVPNPIAARVVRTGAIYTADIITTYLPDTRKLSAYIADGQAPTDVWTRIGEMLRAFHERGVDHPDLTAHNILLDPRGGLFLVDFDNAVVRKPGRWQQAGVDRFKRSLRKVALETGTEFDPAAWQALERAYRRERS